MNKINDYKYLIILFKYFFFTSIISLKLKKLLKVDILNNYFYINFRYGTLNTIIYLH